MNREMTRTRTFLAFAWRRLMRRHGGLRHPLLGLALVLVCQGTAPRSAAGQTLPCPEGVYLFSGGEEQRQGRGEAIVQAAEEFTPILRPIARRVMRRWIVVPPRVVVERDGDQAALVLPPLPARFTELDGTPLRFNNAKGQAAELRRWVRDRRIVEAITNERSRQKRIFTFSRSCRQLETSWHIVSEHVQKTTVEFDLSYRRR